MPEPGQRFDRADGEPYRPESRSLDPREIVVLPEWNVRDVTTSGSREHIEGIKKSILARVNGDPPLPGLIKPLEVRYDRKTGITTLIDGECRLIASRELWDEGHHIFVPCKVIDGTEEQLFAASITSNGGRPLTQWEDGVAYRKLHVGYGWGVDRIAANVCKSKRYVTDAISLSDVSIDARAMLAAGEVTPGAVLHAVKSHNGDSTAAVADLKQRVEAAKPTLKAIAEKRKPKPVSRPKAQSEKEKLSKETLKIFGLADELAFLVLNETVFTEIDYAAKAYLIARGI